MMSKNKCHEAQFYTCPYTGSIFLCENLKPVQSTCMAYKCSTVIKYI